VANEPENLFWDSCILCAHLFEESVYDIKSIAQFLLDAHGEKPKYKIYTSSLIFTEILDSAIKKKGIGTLADFLKDFEAAITLVDPTPPILQLAGKLKDIPYKKGNSDKKRRLTTGDAIMLATCLHLQDTLGVTIAAFHTYDDGGTKREVPLLSYHEWCEGLSGNRKKLADRVCALKRERPIHPTPDMFTPALTNKPPTAEDIKH
jgi:predicted nucleic acid-binding protein